MGVRRYKLVVSDFHLGKGRYFKDGTQNILEDFIYDREFAQFLNYYCSGSFADAEVELVLNGDILNLLQIDSYGVHSHLFTERMVTRAVRRIVAGHPEFFEALKQFTSIPGHTVSYVVGNHDMGMLWGGPRRVFEEAMGAKVTWYDVAYRFDGVHIEHGQQHEALQRTDMNRPFITEGLPEPVLNLPWGSLFVAEILPAMKQSRPALDKVKPFSAMMRWMLIHDFWFTFRSLLRLLIFVAETVVFRLRYQIHDGVRMTLGMLRQITVYPNFDREAFKLFEDDPTIDVVIMGHTHILRYRQWRGGKEYFNEGSWNEATNLDLADFGTHVRLTYAFIDYPMPAPSETSQPPRPKVRLKEWKGLWRPDMDILV